MVSLFTIYCDEFSANMDQTLCAFAICQIMEYIVIVGIPNRFTNHCISTLLKTFFVSDTINSYDHTF